MSFQLNKNGSGRIIKKQVTAGSTASAIFANTPYLSSSHSTLVNDRNFEPVIPTITATVAGSGSTPSATVTGTLSQAVLSVVENTTPGQASGGKVLSLDNSLNASNIRTLKCNSILANGVNIATSVGDPSSIVVANDYFSDNIPGVATAGKAVVVNSNREISAKKINGVVDDLFTLSEGESVNISIDLNVSASLNSNGKKWFDVVYSMDLKKFLAYGDQIVATSVDGVAWVEYLKEGLAFRKIIWVSNIGKYLATAGDGVWESTDGTDWTKILSDTTIVDVSVGKTIIVSISSTKIFYRSLNGSTWSELNMPAGMLSSSWKAIVYGSSKLCSPRFVVCGDGKMATCVESGVDNGTNWIVTTLVGNWVDISFGNDVFIAVNAANQNNNKFTTSSNGLSWFAGNLTFRTVETGTENVGFKSIKFIDGIKMFFIVPISSYSHVIYTKSGCELGYLKYNAQDNLAGLDYSPILRKIIAVTRGIDISKDPTLIHTLTPRNLPLKYFTNEVEEYLTFNGFFSFSNSINPGHIFACNTKGLLYSTDGTEWNKCIVSRNGGNLFNQVSRNIKCVTYSPVLNKYFACGEPLISNGITNCMQSSDGITWTNFSIGNENWVIEWIVWSSSHGKLYAVGGNSLLSSADGVTWASQTYFGGYMISVLNNNSNEYVVLHGSHSSKYYHILNQNMTYTPSTATLSGLRQMVIFNGNTYACLNNLIYKSTDNGINWADEFNLASLVVGVVYHSNLNCLVAYTVDAKIAVLFSTGGWILNTLSFSRGIRYINSINYSSHYGSIYLNGNDYNQCILKTNPLKAQALVSGDIFGDKKIWKTLPDFYVHNRDMDDNLITSFQNTLSRNVTFSAVDTFKDMVYSRRLERWIIMRNYVSSASVTGILSTDDFLSTPVSVNYCFHLDTHLGGYQYFTSNTFSSTASVIIAYNKTTKATTQLNTSENMAWTGVLNSSALRKYCKELKAVYYIYPSNSLKFLIFSKEPGSYPMFLETITISAFPTTLIDYIYNKEKNILMAVSNISNVRKVTTVDMTNTSVALYSVTLPNETFLRLEYHENAKMFILLSTTSIYYSSNGSVWTKVNNMDGYTFSMFGIKYIPELNVMGLCFGNNFAFSRDGIEWRVISTPVNASPWISFDYNPNQGKIALLRQDGLILLTSQIQATPDNVITPTNGFMSKEKITLQSRNRLYSPAPTSSTVSLDGALVVNAPSTSSRTFGLYNTISNQDIDFYSSVPLKLLNTAPGSNSDELLKINNTVAYLNYKLLNSARFNKYLNESNSEFIQPESFKLVQTGGGITVNNLSTQNINITNSALTPSKLEYKSPGLVIADDSKNVSINKLGLNSLKIKNTIITDSSLSTEGITPPSSSPFLPIYRYMRFKGNQFMTDAGANNILGSAYSSTLNVLVIYGTANSSSINQALYISKDKGKTWIVLGINNGYSFTFAEQEYTCKLKWIPSLSLFCLAQDNNLLLSKDGLDWQNKQVSFGSNPSLFWDSKLNRLAVLTTNKICYPVNANDLYGDWTVPAFDVPIKMAEYMSSLDLYFYRDNSNINILKHTPSIYTNPIVGTNTTTINTISDTILWNGYIYYTNSNAILRRNVAGTGNGDTVLTISGISFKRFTIVEELNILVVFSDKSFSYTSNGTSWTTNVISNLFMPYGIGASYEGVMNNIIWAGDRLFMVCGCNGILLESDLEEAKDTSSVGYLDTLISNKTSYDKLSSYGRQTDLIIRHSSSTLNTNSMAYGNGTFVITGDNINIVTSRLEKKHTTAAHVGIWKSIIWNTLSNQFIKVGNNIMSYSSGSDPSTWTDITPPSGSWETIIQYKDKTFIFESGVSAKCKCASVHSTSSLDENTVWENVQLSTSSAQWNGFNIVNGNLFIMGNNFIAYSSLDNIVDFSAVSWNNIRVDGVWYDIAYGKNLYLAAGVCSMARSRNLSSFTKTFVPRDYHKIIYSSLTSEFYLMSKAVNNFSNEYVTEQTNCVIKSNNGIYWINSFNSYLSSATNPAPVRTFSLSNMYYIKETTQFAFTLNNSSNKYFIHTTPYVGKKEWYKITNAKTFATASGKIEIARGDSVIAAPLVFNVFQDSAAKPGTALWNTVSDRRLKEDIQQADLSKCWNNIDNLTLKRFKWKDEYIDESVTSDRRKLGWIAQDVEKIMPKSVEKKEMFNMEDCRVLNQDEIIMNLFGTAKLLIQKLKEKEDAVFN